MVLEWTGISDWTTVFNGDTQEAGVYTRDNALTYSFPAGTSGDLVIYVESPGSTAGSVTVRVKVVDQNASFSAPGQRGILDFGNVNDIGDITFTPTGAGATIDGITLNGEILVDSGAQWDTSKVWSKDCEGADRALLAFNGDLNSQSYGLGNDEIGLDSPGGLAFQTLRVYGYAEGGNPDGIKYTLDAYRGKIILYLQLQLGTRFQVPEQSPNSGGLVVVLARHHSLVR